MLRNSQIALAAFALVCFAPLQTFQASAADAPILVIDGKIAGGGAVSLTRSQIEALGLTKFVTHTPWNDGAATFEGVSMDKLLKNFGATGDHVTVTALDDYSVDIPIGDFTSHNVILADRLNGKEMAVAEKGPLFVIYPFDDDPATAVETYYARSIWQVAHITVK